MEEEGEREEEAAVVEEVFKRRKLRTRSMRPGSRGGGCPNWSKRANSSLCVVDCKTKQKKNAKKED